MSEFTSYYLYQKYEKRGSQDWIPCVPNVYSITGDTSIPMPVSIKSECDPQCGCSTVQYRWTNIDPSIDWICDGTSKYYKQRREASYDGGTTWIPLDEYQKGSLIEASSSDCTSPTPTLYRWVQTEDTVCVENANSTYTKYYVYKKQQQVNGQWVDVSPAVTKPDGYPLGTYNTLAQCQGLEPQYRWYPSGYTCVGYDKWEQSVKQESYDGETWETVIPVETSATTLIETNSEYCGYVPPTPTGSTKFRATYAGGTTYELECDGNSTLTTGDTKPSGYQYTAMTDAVIGDCITTIDYRAFLSFDSLSSVTIPNSVTLIDEDAFSWDSSITSITIPNSVTYIGDSAFHSCSGLKSVSIPDNVVTIAPGAFSFCTGMTSLSIGSGTTTIGDSAQVTTPFYQCTGLTSITVDNNNTAYDSRNNCNAIIETSTNTLMVGCRNTIIPNTVTSIKSYAFEYCTELTAITIPNSVTSIGNHSFYACSGLTSVSIPNSVTTIDLAAFYRCSGLTSVTIGTGVTLFAGSTFWGCTSLTSITILATTPPTLTIDDFNNTNNCPIYVPAASVNTYKSASGWSTYSSRIQAIP